MTSSGNQIFYDLFLAPLANKPLSSAAREEIKQINNLTPGDFKVVRDRYSFYPTEDIDHSMLIEILQEEAEIKALHHLKKKVGF